MTMISVSHVIVSVLALIMGLWLLRKGRRSLLAFFMTGFIVLDSFGLSFAPYLPLDRSLPYVSNSFFLINNASIDLYARQITSHWIFLSIGWLGMLVEGRWRPWPDTSWRVIPRRTVLYGYLFILVGLAAYTRYFVMGPGMDILTHTRLFFSSTSEAITARVQASRAVGLGQGAFMASFASKVVFPLGALFVMRGGARRGSLVLGLCSLLSVMYALQTRQKAPVLAALLTYYLLARVHKRNFVRSLSRRMMALMALAGVFGALAGAAFYSVNFGLSFREGFLSMVSRLLLVPGATETNFFGVFPDIYRFRGVDKVFNIQLGVFPTREVTIYDIAVAATGNQFSSNASAVAVAWSGAGYLGVAAVGIVFAVSLLMIDRLLQSLDDVGYLSLIALVFPSTIGLVSSSFADFVFNWGGIIIPVLLLVVYRMARHRQASLLATSDQ